jgi:hypothetical protein
MLKVNNFKRLKFVFKLLDVWYLKRYLKNKNITLNKSLE